MSQNTSEYERERYLRLLDEFMDLKESPEVYAPDGSEEDYGRLSDFKEKVFEAMNECVETAQNEPEASKVWDALELMLGEFAIWKASVMQGIVRGPEDLLPPPAPTKNKTRVCWVSGKDVMASYSIPPFRLTEMMAKGLEARESFRGFVVVDQNTLKWDDGGGMDAAIARVKRTYRAMELLGREVDFSSDLTVAEAVEVFRRTPKKPIVPSNRHPFPFQAPANKRERADWLAELESFQFDPEDVEIALGMDGRRRKTAKGEEMESEAEPTKDKPIAMESSSQSEERTLATPGTIYVPPALFEGRSPTIVREAMREEYGDAVIAYILCQQMGQFKTHTGKILYPQDQHDYSDRQLRNKVTALLDQAEKMIIVVGTPPED